MAFKNFDDDIFSPVRFDSSLADSSVNSGGSISSAISFDLGLPFKDSPISECIYELPCVKTTELQEEYDASQGNNRNKKNSEVSNKSLNITKKASKISPSSEDLSTDLMTSSLDKKRLSKDKNIPTKKCVDEILVNQTKGQISKQKVAIGSSEQNYAKQKKIVRPTTLLTHESNAKEKKGENVIIKKSTSLKNIKNKEKVQKGNSANSFEKDSLVNKKALDAKKVDPVKHGIASAKQPFMENKAIKDAENGKSQELNQHLGDSKFVSSPLLQTEHKVIEKIVQDHVSFECDKIRQNIYSRQISFCKQMNKLKDEMERRHSETTERLYTMVEELVKINTFLKENK